MIMAGETDIERRLATLEANTSNTASSVTKIEGYLSRRSEQHLQQHTEVMTTLAVIKNNQDNMKEYQEECTAERKTQDKRLSSVESFQQNQMKIAGAAGGFFGLLITLAAELFKK